MPKPILPRQGGRPHTLAVYVSLLFAAVLAIALLTFSLVIVAVDLDVSDRGKFTIAWSDSTGGFTPFNSQRIELNRGHNTKVLMLWSLTDIAKLQITPLDRPAQVTLRHIVVSTLGYTPVIYNKAEHFQRFRLRQGIKPLGVADEQLRLQITQAQAHVEVDVEHHDTDTLQQQFAGQINPQILLLVLVAGIALGYFYAPAQVFVLIALLFLPLWEQSMPPLPQAMLTLEMTTEFSDTVTVYWSNITRNYSEAKVQRVKTADGQTTAVLAIGDLDTLNSIRINPTSRSGQIKIKAITLRQTGYYPITLTARNHFYAVDFTKQPHVQLQGDDLLFDAAGSGDFFELLLPSDAFKMQYSPVVFSCAFLLLVMLCCALYATRTYAPASYARMLTVCRYVSISLLLLLVVLVGWGVDYAISTKLHDLVLVTAGEQAQYHIAGFPYDTTERELYRLPLIDFAYAVVLLISVGVVALTQRKRDIMAYLLFLGLCLLILLFIRSHSTVVKINLELMQDDTLKVYWADNGEHYAQSRSSAITTQAGTHEYTLQIANLNNIHTLRIEPLAHGRQANINAITVLERGYLPLEFNASNHFYAVEPYKRSTLSHEATTQALEHRGQQLLFGTDTNREYLELTLDPKAYAAPYTPYFYLKALLLLLGLFVSVYYGMRQWPAWSQHCAPALIRTGLAMIVVMIMQLAWLSEYDYHPDERAHINSLDYFSQYSDFPVVGDARAMESYQLPWGISRLDDLGLSYILMGKLKNILTYFMEDTVFTCRAFNSLLVLALLLASRQRNFALFLLPLLCLPQVWYLFSYTNRDGWALFLALLLAWHTQSETGHLQRYLHAAHWRANWVYLLWPAGLLGLLSIELSNYYLFILYLLALLVVQGLYGTSQRKTFFLKCLLFVLLAASVFGVRKAIDIEVNGLHKMEQKIAFAEAIADPAFKPSIAGTQAGFYALRLQQKGVTALELFTPKWEWQRLTYKNFAGMYGNEFVEFSPQWYYDCVAVLYGLILTTLLYSVWRYGTLIHWLQGGIALLFMGGALLMGFLYSWLYDFQPQGRYIFPLIPIFMSLCWQSRALFTPNVRALLGASAILLLLLGMYSFRTVALTSLVL